MKPKLRPGPGGATDGVGDGWTRERVARGSPGSAAAGVAATDGLGGEVRAPLRGSAAAGAAATDGLGSEERVPSLPGQVESQVEFGPPHMIAGTARPRWSEPSE